MDRLRLPRLLATAFSLTPLLWFSPPVSAQLVGYWNLDGDFNDSSGNGNHGMLFGGATYNADSPAALGAGSSVAFDGTAGTYGSINHGTGGLKITTLPTYSVSMWVRGDATIDNADDRIFSEGMTTNTNPLFNMGTRNNTTAPRGVVDLYVRNGAGAANTTNHQYSNGEAFDGSWHHIAWVDNDGILDLYIDGVFDKQFDYSSLNPFTPDTTTIGGILRDTDCCNFTGSIDDVAMWDVTLTADQIAELATNAKTPLTVLLPPPDVDDDGMRDDYEQQIIDADPDDAITTIEDVLPGDDFDNDGSTNEAELSADTDPTDPDSDGDNLNDGDEATAGSDPNVDDTDGDGLLDGDEVAVGTSPISQDTDGDGISDPVEIATGTGATDPGDPGVVGTLAAYWPLDTTDGSTTPDLGPNGYDLSLNNMDAGNFVAGQIGNAAMFDGVDEVLTRVHNPGDELPVALHPGYTVSAWVNIVGTGQNDRRFFSEGSTTNDSPLFNLGTHNLGADGRLDSYIRPSGGPVHEYSNGTPLDGTWHHVAVTGNAYTNTLQVYIDGVLDGDTITFRDMQGTVIDTTSIGGILRAVPSFWVAGMVDDVSLWKAVLPADAIADLASGKTPLDLTAEQLPLSVAADGANLVFEWESKPGMFYQLRSGTNLEAALSTWDLVEVDGGFEIPTTPPTNTATIARPSDPNLFYRVEELLLPPVAIFEVNFDGADPGWSTGFDPADTLENTDWQLGAPSGAPTGPSAAHSGTNCYGTNITANYGISSNTWLRTPAIDLTGATEATLSFWQWVDMDDFDFGDAGAVRVLDAAGTTELALIRENIQGLNPTGWVKFSAKLPAAALGNSIVLEFQFRSDNFPDEDASGWYIDDVLVTVPAS